MTRDEFETFATGKFVKANNKDTKKDLNNEYWAYLKAYVDGAMMAWDKNHPDQAPPKVKSDAT